ncbi:hypothetical protein Hanom_Chr12g01121871 [Helianthus anomalus]
MRSLYSQPQKIFKRTCRVRVDQRIFWVHVRLEPPIREHDLFSTPTFTSFRY